MADEEKSQKKPKDTGRGEAFRQANKKRREAAEAEAQAQAGYEYSQGRLYYLFLKPDLTPQGGPAVQTAAPGNAASGSQDNSSNNSQVNMPQVPSAPPINGQ